VLVFAESLGVLGLVAIVEIVGRRREGGES